MKQAKLFRLVIRSGFMGGDIIAWQSEPGVCTLTEHVFKQTDCHATCFFAVLVLRWPRCAP